MREFIDIGNEHDYPEETKNSTLPIISINIQNLKFKALLDTGAELSLINESIIKQHNENFKHNTIKISKINLLNANGKKFAECNKVLNANFIVENETFQGEFVVMPGMKFDVIMGEDILSKLRAKIDLGERILKIDGSTIPIIKLNGKRAEVHTMGQTMYEVNCFDSPENFNLICPTKYQRTVQNIMHKYKSLINYEPRFATGYVHHLKVDETKAFKCKVYPIPYNHREQVNLEIQNMLDSIP